MKKRLPLTFVLLITAIGLLIKPEATAQTTNDLGISFSNPPQSSCNLPAMQTITVTIHNYGNVTQTNTALSLTVNGIPQLTQVFTGSITPNTSTQIAFFQPLNLSAPGTYMIVAYLPFPDDNLSNNADTIYITNSNMPQGNVSLNFDAAANGTDVLRKVTNANSAITQSAAANNGPIGTGGMIMDGKDSPNWVIPGGGTNPWTSNPDHFAATYFCFNPDSGKVNDTLRLSFDLKQLYKGSHNNTNFRVTVNGQQVGPTYNPPVGGYGGGSAPWTRIELDFSSFLGSPSLEIGLESSVKEEYDNGNGTANLIDNMEVQRIFARMGGTGFKENALKNKTSIFPNPSSGLFKLTLPDNEPFQLEITDLTGKVFHKQEIKTKHHQLDLRGEATGMYLLKISGETGTAVHKLIMR